MDQRGHRPNLFFTTIVRGTSGWRLTKLQHGHPHSGSASDGCWRRHGPSGGRRTHSISPPRDVYSCLDGGKLAGPLRTTHRPGPVVTAVGDGRARAVEGDRLQRRLPGERECKGER